MGYLSSRETDQLFLPSNPSEEPQKYWVRMKKKAEYGDTRAAQNAMLQVHNPNNGNGNGAMVTEFEVGAFIGTLTVRLITEWNLTGVNEEPLPITVANLDLLEDQDGEFLASEAQNRKGGRPPEREAPFPKPSGQPSAATGSRTRRSAG